MDEIERLKANGSECQNVLEREIRVVDPKLIAQVEKLESMEVGLRRNHKLEIKALTEKNDKEIEHYMEKIVKLKEKYKKKVQKEYKEEVNQNEHDIAKLTAQLKKANEKIDHKEKHLTELKEADLKLKKEITKKNKILTENKSYIEELTTWMKEKEERVQKLSAQVATYRVGVTKKT